MTCAHCGHDGGNAKFCPECGQSLARSCAQCRAPLAPDVKFCGECGAPVSGDASSAPRNAEPEGGERRQLTVLFCDLVGSTPLSQQLDAEEWRDVVTRYHATARAAVERFGGHVAQLLGDGLLVYFGWPTAREDDPERAIRAGLAMLDAMGPLNAALALPDGVRLAVRIGMHTGAVVVAADGAIFGDTANIAARVQSAAAPETVVVTAATQRRVAGMFVVEERGPEMLKGVREPVVLYRVVQPSGVRSRLDVAAGRLTRFVGREVELATLVERWERAADGDGQNVLVVGEAGVGKSRLAYQLRERLASVPHTWLECGASPYTEGTPFHPVMALVAQGLAFTPADTPAEKVEKITRGLRDLATPESVGLLADFLGLPPPVPFTLNPDVQRRKTMELLAQWNLAISTIQPLVLLVEDLHWCDASSLELLGRLIAQSATARVLFVATARPELTAPWPARSNLTTLPLTRLTKRQAREMVTTLAGETVPAETLEALVVRADGVPLYVEELTKAVAESGAARGVEAIPASLADSLMARLDRLSAAKEVAQRAAVLGREFGYPLLAAMAGMDEAALRHGLARLVDAEILFARGEPPAATYTFKHALIQETAYQSLLKRTRGALHARVVRALVAEFPQQAEAEPEVVARHAEAAELRDEAVAYYERTGIQAQQRSAHEEAILHLRKAIAHLGTLRASPERDTHERRLQMELANSLIAVRGYAHGETQAAHERAWTLCENAGDTAELAWVLRGLASFYVTHGELDRSIEVAERVLAIGEKTRDDALLVLGHVHACMPRYYQGLFTASLASCERAIALYDPARHRGLALRTSTDPGVVTRAIASWNLLALGRPERGLARAREAVALAHALGHPFSLAFALLFETMVHWIRRDHRAQHERAAEVIALSEAQGFPLWLGVGRAAEGNARAALGSGAEVVADVMEGLALAAGTGNQGGMSGILVLLAETHAAVGQHADALRVVETALAIAAQSKQPYFDTELHRLKGEALLVTQPDGHAEVERIFRCALEIARAHEGKFFELRAAVSLARLLRSQGRTTEARAELAPVYAWFTEGFATRDLIDAKALLDDLA